MRVLEASRRKCEDRPKCDILVINDSEVKVSVVFIRNHFLSAFFFFVVFPHFNPPIIPRI